jgi:hypothetical protein
MELGDGSPGDPPLHDELQSDLRDWAAFAAAAPDAEWDLVRRRGRQLASRVARVRGRPVDFVDPVSGSVESVRAAVSTQRSSPARSALAVQPAGPTPWSTGLPVAAFFAVLVTVADVLLSTAFAEAFGLWWVPANLLVGLGLAPSLYLLRAVPFWRWPALGTTVGLAVAWVVLLTGSLG